MIHDPVQRGQENYNSNFSVHSLSSSYCRKHKWQQFSRTYCHVTGIKVAIFNVNQGRGIHDLYHICCRKGKDVLKSSWSWRVQNNV